MAISKLNNVQLGSYAESLVKGEFIRHGMEVYSTDADDRGIDFVIGHRNQYCAVQVKSVMRSRFIYFEKSKFQPRDNLIVAIVLFDRDAPKFYLVPSTRWNNPDKIFKSSDYEGKKSNPEYSLYLGKRNLLLLETYSFDRTCKDIFQ